jgi:hypothetical protein
MEEAREPEPEGCAWRTGSPHQRWRSTGCNPTAPRASSLGNACVVFGFATKHKFRKKKYNKKIIEKDF